MAQPVVVCASWTIPAPSPKTFCPSPQYTQPHRPPSILPNADRTGQRCNHIRLPPPAPADKLSKATPWIRCPSSPPPGSCPQGEALDTATKLSVSWQLHTRRSLGLQPLVTRSLPSLGTCRCGCCLARCLGCCLGLRLWVRFRRKGGPDPPRNIRVLVVALLKRCERTVH